MSELFTTLNQLYTESDTVPLVGSTLDTPDMTVNPPYDLDELCINPYWYTDKAFGVELENASPVDSLLVYFYCANGIYYQDSLGSVTFKIYGSADNSSWTLLETKVPEDGCNLSEVQDTVTDWTISKLVFKITPATYKYFKLIPQSDLIMQGGVKYGVCYTEAYGQRLPDSDSATTGQAIKADLSAGNSYAFDGYITGGTVDYHSDWYGPIGQDFGVGTTIKSVRVRQFNHLSGDHAFTELEVLGWDDANWKQLHYVEGITSQDRGKWVTCNLDCTGLYRYYLVRATTSGTDTIIQEIEMFTTISSTDSASGSIPGLIGGMLELGAGESVTGDLPTLTGSITGEQENTGSIAGTMGGVSGEITEMGVGAVLASSFVAMTGDITAGGATQEDLPAMTGSVTGKVGTVADASGSFGAVDGAMVAGATAAGSFSYVSGGLTSQVGNIGNIAGNLPVMSGGIAGDVEMLADVSGNIPAMTGSCAGTQSNILTLASSFNALSGGITGVSGTIANLNSDLPNVTGGMVATTLNTGNLSGEFRFTGIMYASHTGSSDNYIVRYRRP